MVATRSETPANQQSVGSAAAATANNGQGTAPIASDAAPTVPVVPNVAPAVDATMEDPSPSARPVGRVAQLKWCIELLVAETTERAVYLATTPPGADSARLRNLLAEKQQDLSAIRRTLKQALDTTNPASSSAAASGGDAATVISRPAAVIVPRNLQPFQWEGQVHDSRAPVAVDLDECLSNFTDILGSYGMNIDQDFARLLPPLFGYTVKSWFKAFLSSHRAAYQREPTFEEFSRAIKDQYGLNIYQERSKAVLELGEISMHRNESIEAFISRFNLLRRKAGDRVMHDSVLIEHFCSAMPDNVQNSLVSGSSFVPEAKRTNVEYMMNAAKDMFRSFKNMKSSAAPRAPKRPHYEYSEDNRDNYPSSHKSKYAP
ncbi:hypothetical protein ABG067_007869, partial [Albugo candida]